MTEIQQQLAEIGYQTLLKIRLDKLRRGRPFMINSPDLPSTQCYMEYADGTIYVEQINGSGNEFKKIKSLSAKEEQQLREKLGLMRVHA